MTTITIYGTVTSPYVRRIRAVAHELGLAIDLIDTATDEGQRELRATHPLWKVPTARIGETTLFDSTVIAQHLLKHHGPAPMRAWDEADTDARNLVTVIDGALDALINAFYLAKDGVKPDVSSYVAKQHARAESAMAWIEERIPEAWLATDAPFGLPELALYTTADWMRFRSTYDVSPHPRIVAFMEAWAQRPSLVATAPPA